MKLCLFAWQMTEGPLLKWEGPGLPTDHCLRECSPKKEFHPKEFNSLLHFVFFFMKSVVCYKVNHKVTGEMT